VTSKNCSRSSGKIFLRLNVKINAPSKKENRRDFTNANASDKVKKNLHTSTISSEL
jgi:hypothetical protein